MIAAALLVAGLAIAQGPAPGGTPQPTPTETDTAEPAAGDNSNASDLARAPDATEWIIGAGAAKSVELFHSRGGIRYAVQTVSAARELTGDHGPGILRGRFAWVVEVMPVLIESSPSRVYGFGVSPIGLRWNFAPYPRWSAFTELAGGLLGSSAPIPDGLAQFNFTAHWGAGLRLAVQSHKSVVMAYRLEHISNGNRLPDNPGANSHVVFMGLSLVRRR